MKELEEYVLERYVNKFGTDYNFDLYYNEYKNLDSFAPNGNVNDIEPNGITDEVHFIMRTCTQYYINKAFKAMRINLDDPNVSEDLKEGNIGTPGRIAKVWCGDGTHDDRELGSGRWSEKPRLAAFPNTGNKHIPITKRVDIVSNCSHHFITFSSLARENSYAIISYIPDEHVLGISKLQRVTDWVSQRFFLQEDLTKMLYDEVSKSAKTDSVYVGLFHLVHGCESFRGSKSNDGTFTSEYYGGDFENVELRNQVKGN